MDNTPQLRRDGTKLFEQTTPGGAWIKLADSRAEAVRALAALPESQRQAVLALFRTPPKAS